MLFEINIDANGYLAIGVIVFAVVMSIVGLLTSKSARKVYKSIFLKRNLKKISPYFFNDLDLNHLGDYLTVSKYGVYLIKIINTEGEFFGNESRGNWTLQTKKFQKTVKNPIKMVQQGCSIIKEKYGISVNPVLIFNFGKTEGVDSKIVVKTNNLVQYISAKEVYDDEMVKEIYHKLLDLKVKKLEK